MNELDILANLDPMELSRDDKALEALIAMYRKQRAQAAAGIKPKKEGATIDIMALLDGVAPQEEKPKLRRI